MTVVEEFQRRLARIPHHGMGLSVDVYQPDLFELLEALDRRSLTCGYLEIFKAAQPALARVRRRLPDLLLAYHAEGLWVTQPDMTVAYPFDQELATAAAHVRTLGCHWMNHECASKQMAGYAFGTYLPPLFTKAGAEMTARQIGLVQDRLDQHYRDSDGGVDSEDHVAPLVLLEMPPLTYFAFGDLPIAEFFRRIADRAPCGMVLDIGHLWTVYRYSDDYPRRGLTDFLGRFLDVFPLERVVQIHIAGLAEHEAIAADGALPDRWIDAHGAPIPEVLFDMLEIVLAHPNLRALKGMALEVDNKEVPVIVEEFHSFTARFSWWTGSSGQPQQVSREERPAAVGPEHPVPSIDREALLHQYELYARLVTGGLGEGAELLGVPALGLEPDAIEIYRRSYWSHEILHWGGEIEDMFPATCRLLGQAGVSLRRFVAFWSGQRRGLSEPYDFFLVKIERFVEFVEEVLPSAAAWARDEAGVLRQAYRSACELELIAEGPR